MFREGDSLNIQKKGGGFLIYLTAKHGLVFALT